MASFFKLVQSFKKYSNLPNQTLYLTPSVQKPTCQLQIKFITAHYLQMYKTLQLCTNIFALNTIIFTIIKVIKNTYVQTQKLLKMPSSLKLGLN
jgi:hypothetical protein